MVSKGQAVIMDAILFLIICVTAASMLLWGGVTYGTQSYDAYSLIYLNDFQTTSLATMTAIKYNDVAGASHSWIEEVGRYMGGEFDEANAPARYNQMKLKWDEFCDITPLPLLLEIYTLDPSAALGYGTPLYFGCTVAKDSVLHPGDKMRVDEWLMECVDASDTIPRCSETTEPVCWDGTKAGCAGSIRTNVFKYSYYSTTPSPNSCGPLVSECYLQFRVYY